MIALEDFHEDILAKAMRGLGIGKKNEIAERVGAPKSSIESILNGTVDDNLIKKMANELQLDGEKLIVQRKRMVACPAELIGLKQISSSYGDMIVNSYVTWDEAARSAWVFDTGTDEEPILQFIDEKNFKVDAIFLTHTHRDHISCLDELLVQFGEPKSLCSSTGVL